MPRLLLVVVLLLVALIAAGRLARSEPPESGPVAFPQAPPAALPRGRTPPPLQRAPNPGPAQVEQPLVSRTPTIDRLARLAARRRIVQLGSFTYLDSLLVSADSIIRRWGERVGRPITVTLMAPGLPGFAPWMITRVRDALRRWEDAGVGIRFQETADSAQAEIVIGWIDKFDLDRTGQADVQSSLDGTIHLVQIRLALRRSSGPALSADELLMVATHEIGHALGLPHSGDAQDVMFGTTRTALLSPRDRATIALLYSLPPGSLRDETPR